MVGFDFINASPWICGDSCNDSTCVSGIILLWEDLMPGDTVGRSMVTGMEGGKVDNISMRNGERLGNECF